MLKILTLIFTALIPAVIGILGIVGTRELWDVNILEKFREVHFDSSEYRRRLSPYLVRQIKRPDLRQQLRQFIFWDVMERNFTGGDAMKEFKPDHQDWHLLGDAMLDRKAESGGEDFLEWWREYKRLVCKRWPNRATTIDALYGYLDEWYFGSGWDKRSPIASCQARQPRS